MFEESDLEMLLEMLLVLKKKLLLQELQLVGTSSHDALQATSSAALEWTQVLSIPRPIYEIIMHLSAAHSLN